MPRLRTSWTVILVQRGTDKHRAVQMEAPDLLAARRRVGRMAPRGWTALLARDVMSAVDEMVILSYLIMRAAARAMRELGASLQKLNDTLEEVGGHDG